MKREADVYIVTEFTRDEVPTGLGRRSDHLEDHLRRQRLTVDRLVLSEMRRSQSGLMQRLQTARHAAELLEVVPQNRPMVLVGLGTPTMLMAARALARAGRPVVFDHCDSVLLQLRERLRLGDARLIAIAVWLLLLHCITSRHIALSYISSRDVHVDRFLNCGRTVVIAGPSAPASLSELPPVGLPVLRIVAPVELASLHARRGFDLLLDAAQRRRGVLPVELYGPTPPTEPLPDRMRYIGWAPSLADLYRDSTVVVVTNIGGSGVPNKLVEAVEAGRPVIMHPSMRGRWAIRTPVHLFRNASQLAEALDAVERGDLGERPKVDAVKQAEHGSLAVLLTSFVRRHGVTR